MFVCFFFLLFRYILVVILGVEIGIENVSCNFKDLLYDLMSLFKCDMLL